MRWIKSTLDKNNKFKNTHIYNIIINITYNLSALKNIINMNNDNNTKSLATNKVTVQKIFNTNWGA